MQYMSTNNTKRQVHIASKSTKPAPTTTPKPTKQNPTPTAPTPTKQNPTPKPTRPAPKPRRVTPATALTKQIVEFCFQFDHCTVKRCNTIGVPLPGGGMRPSPQRGWPDLFLFVDSTESCLYPRTVCIEIKASKGDKQRESQIEFERDVTSVGVQYYLIHSFEEFQELWQELN